MSNKIEFPYNNKMYLRKAIKCIEHNQFEEAEEFIHKVYETNSTLYVNRIYTLVLYTLEKYEDAFDIASEYKQSYLEDENQIFMFVMLLIKNHQFIEAESVIQNKAEIEPLNKKKWENIKQELETEREQLNLKIERQREETKAKLREIENHSIFEQSEILKNANRLMLEDLQEVARNIFNHPFISGHIQRAFLELLIEMNDENKYSFTWFNEVKEICPNDLKVFDQEPIIYKIIQNLEMKLQKSPSMIEGIKAEVINDLLLLYPFIDEVVTDIDYWVDTYISLFDSFEEHNRPVELENDEQVQLRRWIERLNLLAQRNI